MSLYFCLYFVVFSILLGPAAFGAPQQQPKQLSAVFSLKLLDALERQNGGIQSKENLVICPVALENILDILLLGAEGSTAKQIQAALA